MGKTVRISKLLKGEFDMENMNKKIIIDAAIITVGIFAIAMFTDRKPTPDTYETKVCTAYSCNQFITEDGEIYAINNPILRVNERYCVLFDTYNTSNIYDDEVFDFYEYEEEIK